MAAVVAGVAVVLGVVAVGVFVVVGVVVVAVLGEQATVNPTMDSTNTITEIDKNNFFIFSPFLLLKIGGVLKLPLFRIYN